MESSEIEHNDRQHNGRKVELAKKLRKLHESCRPRSLYLKLKECDVHLYMVTFWGCVGFLGLGCSLLVFGPTLIDLADHLSVGIDALAIMFTCRAIGAAVGSIGSGFVFDKMVGCSYTILCVIYISCIATTVILPLSIHIVMLGAFMFLNGIATGAVDNGTHAVMMRLWRDKAGPCMQVLHFCFAFGAFVAPLIAKTFITESDDSPPMNSSTYSNMSFTCDEISNTSSVNLDLEDFITDNFTYCFELINKTCYSQGKSNTLITLTDDCTISYNGTDNAGGVVVQIAWAYWIASLFFVPSLLAFIYFSTTKELCKKCLCRKKVLVVNSEETTEEEEQLTETKTNSKKSLKQPVWYLIVLFTLLFLFMFMYVGLEVAYGSLIFTVAVKGELNFSKPDAAVLTSLFWGTFAFTRLFSVILAVLKVRSSMMMAGNLSGSFLASLILVFYPHNSTAVWIGSAVLGASYASIYPTAMTWMSENTVATGKATSVLVAAGTIGDISIPSIVGVIIARVSPDLLFYITFSGVILSAILVSILFLVARLYTHYGTKKVGKKTPGRVRYEKLDEGITSDIERTDLINGDVNRDTQVVFESSTGSIFEED